MSTRAKTIVVLIAGGHAAGKSKTTELLTRHINKRFKGIRMKSVDMQDYELQGLEIGNTRLSNPSRFRFDDLISDIEDLIDNSNNETKYDLVIVHGLYALYDKKLLSLGTLKIFIDCDADVRIGRWIKRDILGSDHELNQQEASKVLKHLLTLYLNHAKVEMNQFIFQTKQFADIILPRGAEMGSISLIIDGLQPLMKSKESNNQYDSISNVSTGALLKQQKNAETKKRFYDLS